MVTILVLSTMKDHMLFHLGNNNINLFQDNGTVYMSLILFTI